MAGAGTGATDCMASPPDAPPGGWLLVRPSSLYFLAAAMRAAMPGLALGGPSAGPSDAHSRKGRLLGGLVCVEMEGALSDLILWPRPI